MNERLKELILEAGFPKFGEMYVVSSGEELERYAELVRADEREACAKVCDDLIGTRAMARHCADSIRARSEK